MEKCAGSHVTHQHTGEADAGGDGIARAEGQLHRAEAGCRKEGVSNRGGRIFRGRGTPLEYPEVYDGLAPV
jgi:hypothetical protein